MKFTFNVIKLEENNIENLDEILDNIHNKVIAGQIALYHVCGSSGYEDFQLPNVETEELFDQDIGDVLDAFKESGGYILFSTEKNINDVVTKEYYDSRKGKITYEEFSKI